MAGGKARAGRKSIKDLFREAQYSGPPELFTMWACLFADKDVAGRFLDWLETNSSELRKCLKSYRRQHKISPHPGTLVRIVKSDVAGLDFSSRL